MAGKRRYTLAQVSQALKDCNGYTYLAAERLGCDPDTIANYKTRYPKLAAEVAAMRGKRNDVAEVALNKAVLAGEPWAIQFQLRMQAKDRGYVERQEKVLTTPDGEPLNVHVYIPKNDRHCSETPAGPGTPANESG
jgi:hypothetical protein